MYMNDSLEITPSTQGTDGTTEKNIVIALDTANEVIALGLGVLHPDAKSITVLESISVPAHRASNTRLIPELDALMKRQGISHASLASVCCGRGPGSFTGVRICMATAKGIASACEVPLCGVSTLDALAWEVWQDGVRGSLWVLADAMRKEIYPVLYLLDDAGAHRQSADCVMKADVTPAYVFELTPQDVPVYLTGDALHKYSELFDDSYTFLDGRFWTPVGAGLLHCLEDAWQQGVMDPFDRERHNPALALPVYTRLSDAEENERIRLAKNSPKNLHTGVSEEGLRADQRACAHDSVIANAQADATGILYRPLDAEHAADVAHLESLLMGSDAWSESLVLDDLFRSDRVWWAAYETRPDGAGQPRPARLMGYAGAWIVAGDMQILKVAVIPEARRQGVARTLLGHVAQDARDLGAHTASLEVRVSNEGARASYEKLGFSCIGTRPGYYSDGEDAAIYQGPLPLLSHDVAGITLRCQETSEERQGDSSEPSHPLILAIESSCDETAAAIVDGSGSLLSDVVASQIDFHARFGGVVPEIASRKHIEAICGVCDECLDVAARQLGRAALSWKDLDAIAVTQAPGLVGALVVGVAFAKGAAWGAEIPLVGVNHLEGHLYANKIATPDIQPPMVVSLVSGGHTMLVHARAWGDYVTLGSTIDDAVGEAFDKVAKALGLGYPGGPIISRLAAQGDPRAIRFPRAMMHSHDLRFSLSGLKTAVMTYIQKEQAQGHELNLPDIAASFQQAVIDVQVAKAKTALIETQAREFCLGGGVAANPALRAAYADMCADLGVRLTLPPMSACTDNAGMIALVAFDRLQQGQVLSWDADAHAHAPLDELR